MLSIKLYQNNLIFYDTKKHELLYFRVYRNDHRGPVQGE